jgi:uncharacterized membrane protein
MTSTLITANQSLLLFLILALCAYVGSRLAKIKYVSVISGVALTMLIAGLLSNTGLIPHQAPFYDMVWRYFIPLAVPFFLLQANFVEIKHYSGPTLLAFLFATIGVIVGGILSFYLVNVGKETGTIIGMLAATYIGGSINYVATSQVLGLQDNNLFLAGNAADNLIMALYFVWLSILGTSYAVRQFFAKNNEDDRTAMPYEDNSKTLGSWAGIQIIICAGLLSGTIFAFATFIKGYVPFSGSEILIITLISLLFANLFPKQAKMLVPVQKIGTLAMAIFFAVIGASSNLKIVVQETPKLFLIVLIIVLSQWIVAFALSKLTKKIDLESVLIACNAAAGGPATAIAMASNHRWPHLVVPGVLCGTLGYALGTFIGVALGYLFQL